MDSPRSPRGVLVRLGARRALGAVVLYALAVFLVVQVAGRLLPETALPDWGTLFVIVLAALAFPLGIVIVWAVAASRRGP